MDEDLPSSRRSRRAIPLIASALTAIVVVGLLYLRAVNPAPSPTSTSARIPTMSGPYAITYDFVSPSVGWALAVDYEFCAYTAPCNNPGPRNLERKFWIFKTEDGASHWRRLYQGQAESVHIYIHFFDALHGLAYVGGLYRTVDGGESWQSDSWQFVPAVADPLDPRPLVNFASPTLGWGLAFEAGESRMYSTTDGGRTWTRLPADIPQTAFMEPLGTPEASGFRASGEGWLGGYFDSPLVYRTTDSGRSWTGAAVPPPTAGGGYVTAVRLAPAGKVLVFVSDEAQLQSVYVSSDLGVSWQELTLPPSLTSVDDLSIADGRHWWASHADELYTTSNAGRTWQRIKPQGLPQDWNYETARVINSTHAWWPMTSFAHSTDRALAMTSDGGATWKMVNPPQPE